MKLCKVKPGLWWLLALSSILFIITRINPLLSHNVAYTYDQGRDFLKASELVDQKDLTFIGPTTGINGLFHGAWWYYLLTIPYLLFQGLPIGFYYFNALIHLISLLALVIFSYLEFGFLIAVFAGLVVISSPYFNSTSLFVGNNIMAIPSVLALVISLYYLIKFNSKTVLRPKLFFINALALGFVSEFELSFGLFLIPSYLIILILFPILRQQFLKFKNWFWFMFGLGLVFLPRILFELKNNFSQTKILLGFFLEPKLHNPKSFVTVLKERWQLFQGYYESLFTHQFIQLAVSFFLIGILIYSLHKKSLKKHLIIILFLLFLLFTISLVYKDNFWGNYFEGVHYLILIIILLIFKQSKSWLTKLFLSLTNGFLTVLLLIKIFSPTNDPTQLSGLAAHEAVVDYIYKNNGQQSLINIYTPPAIPYTYRYLFYYHHRFNQQSLVVDKWTSNNTGWYILEHDDFADRKQNWININIPNDAKLIKNKKIANIEVQQWKR